MKLTQVTAEEFFNIHYRNIGEKKLDAALFITVEGGRTSKPLLELLSNEEDVDFPVYNIHVSPEVGIPDIVYKYLQPKDLPLVCTYRDGQTRYMMIGTPDTYKEMPDFVSKIMS